MLRGLPNWFTRSKLHQLLVDEGLSGSYDFVYLPIDFASHRCLGHAFVNFHSAVDAARAWQIFDGFADWGRPSTSVCELAWSDPRQGLQAHIEHYRNSPVMHKTIDDEWKPVIFKNGEREARG